VIRNEALLLLSSLTLTNEEMKKIVVFEGCFDRLLGIIREEGAADGGIVVQDCLCLMSNLLRDSSSNQVFFRESSFLPSLAAFIQLRSPLSKDVVLPPQRAANLLCVLQTISLLCSASVPDSDRKANQSILVQHQAMEHLLPLALHASAPSVQTEALWCIGELVANHPANQNVLGASFVDGELDSVPALNMVVRVVLRWREGGVPGGKVREAEELSKAAVHVFEAYCQGNPDGQLLLASTIMPLEEQGGGEVPADHCTFGGLLCQALLNQRENTGRSSGSSWVGGACGAALVLQHLLAGNTPCKERVLHIPLLASSPSKEHFLLPSAVRILRQALEGGDECIFFQGALLRFLVTWLTDCPPAVSQFLATSMHLPLVVETALGGASAHVKGLATLLLGVCVLHNQVVGELDGAAVVDVVVARVGLSCFFLNLEALRATPAFAQALQPPAAHPAPARGGGQPEVKEVSSAGQLVGPEAAYAGLYDPAFAQWAVQFSSDAGKAMVTLYARPKQLLAAPSGGGVWEVGEGGEEAKLERAHALIRTQDTEIAELRGRNVGLAERLVTLAKSGAGGSAGERATIAGSPQEEQDEAENMGGGGMSNAEAAGLVEQSKVKLAQVEAQLAEVKREAEKKTATLKAQLEESHAHLARNEESLKSLSEAYNGLEADVYRHEERERDLRAQVRAAEERVKAAETAGSVGGQGNAPDAGALAAAREEGYSTASSELTPKIEQARTEAYAEGREEAEKEGEGEMNDLLVCLGQEESKTEKLRERLEELGEDVDALLEGVGVAEEEDEDDEIVEDES